MPCAEIRAVAPDDSMSPVIHEGEEIFADPTARLTPGCVALVVHGGDVYVRRWARAGGNVTLSADAPGYSPVTFQEAGITVQFRVVRVRTCRAV
jgi:phage repressor protein C with HTH and peptisase S24 domain